MQVVKPSLCSLVWWAVLCLLAAPTKSHQYESELEMGELQYSRLEVDDERLKDAVQILDVLKFQLDGASSEDVNVSLFLYDVKERVWQEAGFNREEIDIDGGDDNSRIIALTKPLIGYDLLKNNGCGEASLKAQPFAKYRWGDNLEEKEKWTRCYLVAVEADDYSVFKTYPDNCVEESRKIQEEGTGILLCFL